MKVLLFHSVRYHEIFAIAIFYLNFFFLFNTKYIAIMYVLYFCYTFFFYQVYTSDSTQLIIIIRFLYLKKKEKKTE